MMASARGMVLAAPASALCGTLSPPPPFPRDKTLRNLYSSAVRKVFGLRSNGHKRSHFVAIPRSFDDTLMLKY